MVQGPATLASSGNILETQHLGASRETLEIRLCILTRSLGILNACYCFKSTTLYCCQSDLSESHVCSFLSPVKNDLWLGIFCTIKSSHPHKIVRHFITKPSLSVFLSSWLLLIFYNCCCAHIEMLFHSPTSLHVLSSLYGMATPHPVHFANMHLP